MNVKKDECILSREEYGQIWAQVQKYWGPIDGYWYPLNGEEQPADILTFPLDVFYQHVHLSALRTILKQHKIMWMWELREDYTGEEICVDSFCPDYTGVEGYWTSFGCDWLLYVSHENSITLAGTWFIEAVKSVWS